MKLSLLSRIFRPLCCALLLGSGLAFGQSLSFLGNTTDYETGNGVLPSLGPYIEPWQTVSVTTQTYPISQGQSVNLIYTTDHFATTHTISMAFDKNVNNNTQWYAVLGPFVPGTDVEYYLQAQTTNGTTLYDSNGGQNYGFTVRFAPQGPTGAILQWFATPYATILKDLPEVAQAGYGAIYLPPPQKSGGGGFSVGYNPFDRFDLGDRFQDGTVATQYGTAEELQQVIALAHRLGLKVYCDLVFNHNDDRASTPIDGYPNLIPEDFHIFSSANTGNNQIDFNNAPDLGYNILNYDLSGLADLAQEDGNLVESGPFTLPSWASFNQFGKPTFVRQPLDPQDYPNNTPVPEDVRQYLKRWGWYLTTKFDFDGYRLDAVRHMDPAFFDQLDDQGGFTVNGGGLLPYLYSLNPNLFIFSEDNTTDPYEMREFLKTGMNLLDFPLLYATQSLFNSNGYGNLGQTLANGFSLDSATGCTFQNGGLSPDLDVSFIQSHDTPPPVSNNLASAFALTRPGASIVYFDGNNLDPSNFNQFPKPGRFDALGAGDSITLKLADARARFNRGLLVNRYVSGNCYIYERVDNNSGLMLVGLNNRGDLTSITETVQTAFPANTVLEDLSGQEANVTVNSQGQVTITIPPNSSSTNSNNATGYVLYVPIAPHFQSVGIYTYPGGAPTVTTTVTTPAGTYGPAGSYPAIFTSASDFGFSISTDSANTAFVKIDNGYAAPGYSVLQNTPEGLTDGFIPMVSTGGGKFQLNQVNISPLGPGLHELRFRIFSLSNGGPGVYRDFVRFVFVRPGTLEAVNGNLATMGNPLATQTNTPSSQANRLDELFASNDSNYLYLGMAGSVDPSLNYTNGMVAYLDVDGGPSGFSNFKAIADDSGPAARLFSNANLTAPNGFQANFALSSFRLSTLSGTPEAPFADGCGNTDAIGAMSGFFALNPATPGIDTALPCTIAWQPRSNPFGPQTGLQAAIPLSELFPAGISPGATIKMIGMVDTTGESGTVLQAHDPLRGTLGGRPAANSYVTNQFLPVQSGISTDPGTAAVQLNAYVTYHIQFAQDVSSVQITPTNLFHRGNVWYEGVTVVNTGTNPIPAPADLVVHFGRSGITMLNATGKGLIDPNSAFLQLARASLPAGAKVQLFLQFQIANNQPFTPTFQVRTGYGVQ